MAALQAGHEGGEPAGATVEADAIVGAVGRGHVGRGSWWLEAQCQEDGRAPPRDGIDLQREPAWTDVSPRGDRLQAALERFDIERRGALDLRRAIDSNIR